MTDHSSRSHKRFAASAAERWMNCPGSIRLCESLPEPPPSPYALEGTRKHELLEGRLKSAPVGGYGYWTAGEEDIKTIYDYVVEIHTKCMSRRSGKMQLESQVRLSEDVGGTLDCYFYSSKHKWLEVIDAKFGSGVPVEVKNNKQLKIYAKALLEQNKWNVDIIKLTIAQPNCFHPDGPIRSWEITPAELFDFEVDVLEARARCLEPDAPLIPGEEQCRWCPAKAVCPAREKMALAVVNSSFNHVKQITPESLPAVKEMTPDRIGQILAVKKMVVDWLDSVEEEGRNQALAGTAIPGMKLVEPVGRRSWEGEQLDLMIQLAALTKTEPSNWTEMRLVGVTEADKRFKEATKDFSKEDKEAAKARYAHLTTKKSSGNLQLVPESDRRSAVQAAGQAFGGVVQLPVIGKTGE